MDTFGHEVAVKIKSAIKAKLMELNSYVDDELPDYIMVMVANKKSKSQMSSDLALFLGENASKFCDWLDDVLKRIQSVTIETQKKPESVLEEEIDTKTDLSNGNSIVQEANNETLNKQEMEVLDEVLAIKAEPDDLLGEEISKEDKDFGMKQESILPQDTTNQQRPPRNISPITMSSTDDDKSAGNKLSPLPVNRKRKLPSSAVGAVLKREYPQEEDEEEYDPRHPSIGSVASVVQVSKRRPLLPPEKQANSTLLLKAVNDAQKSVLNTKSSISIKSESTRPAKLFTKSYLEREKQQKLIDKKRKAQVTNRLLDDVDHKDSEESPARTPEDSLVDNPMETTSDNNNTQSKSSSRLVVLNEKEERRSASPEFIITLDGVDTGAFTEETMGDDGEIEEEIEMTVSDADNDLLPSHDEDGMMYEEESEPDENKNQTSGIRCKYWPVCKNGNECVYRHPTVVCKTFPSCKFGSQCLYIHPNCKFDATCSRKDCPFTHASPRNSMELSTKNRPSNVSKRQPLGNSGAFVSKITCRNFPSCKNVDCPFHHPKSCRYGHGCTRTDCIFFHPTIPNRDKMKWKAKSSDKTELDITPISNSIVQNQPICITSSQT